MKNIDKIWSMEAILYTPVTAFRLATETDDLPPMKIFSAICLRDTGLISVFDEMDEEYWQDLIDRCILCHPSDGIPTCDWDRWCARVDVICGDLITLFDATVVYLWSRWLKYARYDYSGEMDDHLSHGAGIPECHSCALCWRDEDAVTHSY